MPCYKMDRSGQHREKLLCQPGQLLPNIYIRYTLLQFLFSSSFFIFFNAVKNFQLFVPFL
jgi:hypothetical protein